jgi:PIN domain nuclease of toxin-antitoxin system
LILLDTHIWAWWVHNDPLLPSSARAVIVANEATGIYVSVISCWEIAKLFELRRISLPCPLLDWLQQAIAYPGIRIVELTPAICAASVQLPGTFHRDPADQIIVATARVLDAEVVTIDGKILKYPHVKIATTP